MGAENYHPYVPYRPPSIVCTICYHPPPHDHSRREVIAWRVRRLVQRLRSWWINRQYDKGRLFHD